MRELARDIITSTATACGLPEGRVMNQVKKDNLTIERPRIELQYLPEKLTRTGRKLGVWRTKTEQWRKREIYQAELDVAANILADDASWLASFSYDFLAQLPRGLNDSRDNWVRVRGQKATFGRPPDKRVGDDVIEVFQKVNELLLLTFTWRVTAEEAEQLIQTWKLNIHMK